MHMQILFMLIELEGDTLSELLVSMLPPAREDCWFTVLHRGLHLLLELPGIAPSPCPLSPVSSLSQEHRYFCKD